MDSEPIENIEDSAEGEVPAPGGVDPDPDEDGEVGEDEVVDLRPVVLLRDPAFDAAPWAVLLIAFGVWFLVFYDFVLS